VDLHTRNLEGNFLVTAVTITAAADQSLRFALELLSGGQAQSTWLDFWRQTLGTSALSPVSAGTFSGSFVPVTPAPVGEWASYTPTWSNTGTQPSVGNGSLTGKYTRIGKTVVFEVLLSFGSTTSGGTGSLWTFSLPPVTPAGVGHRSALGPVLSEDVGVADYPGTAIYDGASSFFVLTNSTGAPVTQAAPMTWGSTDFLTVKGSYEAE
jgi:hypothetical protein